MKISYFICVFNCQLIKIINLRKWVIEKCLEKKEYLCCENLQDMASMWKSIQIWSHF